MNFIQTKYDGTDTAICMFADGAGISLSLRVPASSEGERRGLGEPRINYRYAEQMHSIVV